MEEAALPYRMMKMQQRTKMGSQGYRQAGMMQFSERGGTCHPASLGSVTLLEILVLLQRSILQNLILYLQVILRHTQKEASLPSAEMPFALQNLQTGQTPSSRRKKISKECLGLATSEDTVTMSWQPLRFLSAK